MRIISQLARPVKLSFFLGILTFIFVFGFITPPDTNASCTCYINAQGQYVCSGTSCGGTVVCTLASDPCGCKITIGTSTTCFTCDVYSCMPQQDSPTWVCPAGTHIEYPSPVTWETGCVDTGYWDQISCFPTGTKVDLADGSQKNIEEIQEGDSVVSQSVTGEQSNSIVNEIETPIRDHLCRISFDNSDPLELTSEHPLLSQDGWKSINPEDTAKEAPDLPVTKLTIGDSIVKNDEETAKVKSFTCWSEQVQTYNLKLDGNVNTYFADGYLAHNKSTTYVWVSEGEWCKYLNCGVGRPSCQPPAGSQNISWPGPYPNLPWASGCLTGNAACADGTRGCATCACVIDCTKTAPATIVLGVPANGAEVPAGNTSFTWNPETNWGNECSGTVTRSYTYCMGANASNPCTGGISHTQGTSLTTKYAVSLTPGTKYWNVKATNAAGLTSPSSQIRSVCVEGYSATNTAYVSAWSACSASTHKRTRTCREDCGTNDCTGVSLTEDCLGAIRGTLFDASEYDICPAFDPATGYLTGLPAGVGAASHGFGLTDQSSTPPHPWAPLSPVTTDANGNYNIQVYSPATYQYDFSSLSDIYSVSGGPKLTCTSSVAVVPGSASGCTTQPCSLVNNMSFGFNRIFGGWWQAVGGSVYADDGIKSTIPTTLSTEQSLILPDTTAGNRVGYLAYGITRPSDIFGENDGARVSTPGWEKESRYAGQVYDWSFYNTQFNKYPRTTWNGTDPIVYNDGGQGYQIFQTNTSVTSFTYSPLGTEKVMVHVSGDVRVTGDITVPDGAFLAVIASGTITFDQNITRADGWYIAANLSIPCTDVVGDGCDEVDNQFLGNGSFIGWQGVSLSRHQGLLNNTQPSEKFTYRRDIYDNAPLPLKNYYRIFKPFTP